MSQLTSWFIVVLAVILASPAQAQSTQPESSTGFESRPIRRAIDAGSSATAAGSPAPASAGGELARMLAALGIVLAVIGILWWVGRRFFNPHRLAADARGVRVLSRQPIAPRQQVLLLQVGTRRVVVVADSGGALTTLANIDDPDEVAQLIGTTSPTNTVTATSDERDLENATPRDFEAALGVQQARLRPDDAGGEAAQESAARNEVSSLLGKVKSLRAQLQR